MYCINTNTYFQHVYFITFNKTRALQRDNQSIPNFIKKIYKYFIKDSKNLENFVDNHNGLYEDFKSEKKH